MQLVLAVDAGGAVEPLHGVGTAADIPVGNYTVWVEITDGATARHRMVFADGTWLETDMIVFSAGIRPRDELARDSGLALGARGGIVIDEAERVYLNTDTTRAVLMFDLEGRYIGDFGQEFANGLHGMAVVGPDDAQEMIRDAARRV